MQRASSDKDGGRQVSANILRSSEDLDQFLKEYRERACVVVRHDAADDVGPALLSLAADADASGRPVLIAAPDGSAAARNISQS